jgi:pimeloyl-ACP methyl ester carboxylesterase
METIICIAGLGGRSSLFNKYGDILSDYNLKFVDVINWQVAQKEINSLVEKSENVIFLCNCYGAQLALRAIEKTPEKVSALIVIEPYFGEFFPWRKTALVINHGILSFVKLLHLSGIKRTKFPEIDYTWVERQPLFLQPFSDIRHQSLNDYFGKIDDILTFGLPSCVNTKTLIIFSPKGFVRDAKKRARLKSVFSNSRLVELGKNSHNIMTLSREEIATSVKNWLKLNTTK